MKIIQVFPKRRCVLPLRKCTGFCEKCENGHADVSGKIYAAIMLFRHVQLKVTKLSRNVDMIYYFVTVQVFAKSVKIVTKTFRSKFLKQSSSSVTIKSNKAFPKRRYDLLLRNCTGFCEKCENCHDDI
jgi:hypothetical protein